MVASPGLQNPSIICHYFPSVLLNDVQECPRTSHSYQRQPQDFGGLGAYQDPSVGRKNPQSTQIYHYAPNSKGPPLVPSPAPPRFLALALTLTLARFPDSILTISITGP